MNKHMSRRLADLRIERVFGAHCHGVQIGVMDLGKIFDVGRAAIAAGADDELLGRKIVEVVETIRRN